MSDSVTLTGATRSNLLSLQRTTNMMDTTQSRLATGKKVNSAMDDALAFFTSRNLENRSNDLLTIKDNINEGINVIQTATDALGSVEDVMQQMKAIASSAKSTAAADTAARIKLADQFDELRDQIDHLVDDASYNGVNLIKGTPDTLKVNFSEQDTTRKLEVAGIAADTSATGLNITENAATTDGDDWIDSTAGAYTGNIETSIAEIDAALTTVRESAQSFGTNASTMEIRKEFTENLVSTLQTGAAQLVNADLNEESANMLALKTRQQLGTISLSIANESDQSILRLF
ncbi:MAG: flagellin [Alphaproteobacteria bacterium]|nr:flagellin [Alphaproteobacteria bacterium]